jgi:uncharacterized protein (TIGR00290 family)
MRPKAFVSWSSGKDSAFALHEARRLEMVEVVGLLTTVNAVHHRVAMHGTRESLLDRQIAATGLPCLKVPLPSPCSNEVYETRMAEACAHITAQGVRHIVFGDLFLEDIRAYREARLKEAGMEGVFPLWQRNTHALAHEMIGSGMVAHLVCIDPRRIDRRFAGRRFNSDLLAELPVTADPCGENGEFHTAVSAGPMFAAPIPVEPGEVVERDDFVFADIIPATQ